MARTLRGLCANIPDQPIYGELTTASLDRIARAMVGSLVEAGRPPPRAATDALADLGVGSGWAARELCLRLGLAKGWGCEVSQTRLELARALQSPAAPALKLVRADLCALEHLPTACRFVYTFDKAFPPRVLRAVARLVAASPGVECFVSTRLGAREAPHGFAYTGTVPVAMGGSGARLQAHCFVREARVGSMRT